MTIERSPQIGCRSALSGLSDYKSGDADGQLAGARNTTGNVLRPALQIIKTSPGITCVSGAMLLLTHAPEYGKNGILVMGDVAVTPVPDAEQLAQIAVCTARTAQAVAGTRPESCHAELLYQGLCQARSGGQGGRGIEDCQRDGSRYCHRR